MQMYVSEHANKQHLFFFLFFLFASTAWALFPGDSSSAQALQQQGWACGAREGKQGGLRHRREGRQGSQPFRTNLTGWGGGWGAAPHLSELVRLHARGRETLIT